MSVSTALSQINSIIQKSESISNQLSSLFPDLLTRNTHTAFYELQSTISTLSTSISSSKSSANLATFGEKYNPVFEKLNEKIRDLNSLDKMIAEIKEDSEQMELIALNAMVISVKSGEKGLAFSKITENLQRLSKDMFLYSDKLSAEETELLDDINTLKSIFSGILDAQKSIAAKDNECTAEMNRLVSSISPSMSDLERECTSIYVPIERTRDSIQNLSKVTSTLREIAMLLTEPSVSTQLHSKVADVSSSVSRICQTFASNWSEVIEILDKSDGTRMDFESRFLNNHAFGNDNIEKQLNSIIQKFQIISGEFNKYHMVQKDLQATCQSITTKAKSIYSVFENLRPVMSRLHHVRILQQIEVSKNDAIKSVQDSVTDMDNLINAANASLDQMEAVLESFIHDTSTMLSNFVVSIQNDNEIMTSLRNEKDVCLSDLQNGQGAMASASQSFTVFPEGFQNKCVLVQQNLQEFMRLNSEISMLQNEIEN
ncbi:MAG: hypothetical protein IJ158_00615 [Treponema sp.]|nr:hypothetical protein [Treponema sp.]